MIYVRMKFKKENEGKFISHLDLMRTFQRAMRRAKLPMVFSGGYNPHPEMSFAQALGLGIESTGEYMDVTINDSLNLDEIKERLNNNLTKGIEITQLRNLKDKAKPAMAVVSHGQYLIAIETDENNIDNKAIFEGFINQLNIYVEKIQFKKNKKVIVDIKPMIKEIDMLIVNKVLHINCIIACGSNANLKPELIIDAFREYSNIGILKYNIKRIELFTLQRNRLIPLIDFDNK